MAADLVVLDPATIIDRATYEQPALPSEGIGHVLVNGKVALNNGIATGIRGGRALLRTANMPSRPMAAGARRLSIKGASSGSRVAADIVQRAGAREASGTFTVEAADKTMTITASRLGMLQSADDWWSFTGLASLTGGAPDRAFTAIIDRRDPSAPGVAMIVVMVEGQTPFRGTLPLGALSTK